MIRQIATFMLGDMCLGLDILLVREVYRGVTITPIPDAPQRIRGLINLRGRVVTVMDLNVCLNREAEQKSRENYLLILKTDSEIKAYLEAEQLSGVSLGEDIAGFLIDQMDDVIEIEEEDINPPPPNLEGIRGDLVEGVIKKDERLVILLNVTAILDSIMQMMETNS